MSDEMPNLSRSNECETLEDCKEITRKAWNTRPQADIERLKEIVNALAPGEQNSVHVREGYESAIIDVLAAIDEVMGQLKAGGE